MSIVNPPSVMEVCLFNSLCHNIYLQDNYFYEQDSPCGYFTKTKIMTHEVSIDDVMEYWLIRIKRDTIFEDKLNNDCWEILERWISLREGKE